MRLILILFTIIILGLALRLENISPFKFYPDSYQNLVVAQNILEYKSVFGYLGKEGMFYPYFFMWTRPIYPILINFFNLITGNFILSAHLINIVFGVLSIGVSFLFIRKVFNSSLTGLIAAFLFAISFNSVVWGGFIYTESLGIFLILLLLWRLFQNLDKPSKWAGLNDFLTGLIFCLAVFTRYEYVVLFIPIIFLILQKNPKPGVKITNISISAIFFSSVFLVQLYPLSDMFGLIFNQVQKLIFIFGFFILGFIAFLFLKKWSWINLDKVQPFRFLTFFVLLFGLLLTFQSLAGNQVPLFDELTSVRNFFNTDLLLGVTTLFGFVFLFRGKKIHSEIYFVLISVLLLYPVYYNINPLMQRYITHLIPFLLIPASFAGLKFIQHFSLKQKDLLLILMSLILIAWQVNLSLNGIKSWHEGSWFKESYEEKSAKILKQKFEGTDALLISALPEAYYFFTGLSTHSIFVDDKSPFLDIDPSLDSKEVLIVSDMGMNYLFPNFNNFVTANLDKEKVDEYWVNETYRYAIESIKENHPVRIYKIKLSDLKLKINQTSLHSPNQ